MVAQTSNKKGGLWGIVKDAEEEIPLEQVSVRLLAAKDSALVSFATSDSIGKFRIRNLNPGRYIVSLSFLGYEAVCKNVSSTSQNRWVNVGTVAMNPSGILLKEAVIIGKVPEIVTKEDTIEYNADSYKTRPNAVVEDLLKKLPGVEVDSDGKITAGGKEIKKILVDGKEFFTNDPKVASKNLPVDIVDKLQVIDRKSDLARLTGVDDGEDEKVINLTIKKGMKKGWFGSAEGGYGTQNRYLFNGMLNRMVNESQFSLLTNGNNTNNMGVGDFGSGRYSGGFGGAGGGINTSWFAGTNFNAGKSDKFRVGGDVSLAFSDQDSWNKSQRQNLFADSTSYDNSEQRNRTKSHNLGVNFRMHWELDSLSTIEFMPNFSYNKSSYHASNESATLAGNAERDSVNSTLGRTSGDGHSFQASGRLTVNRKFKRKKGRQLSINFGYDINRTDEDGMNYSINNLYRLGRKDTVDQTTQNKVWGGTYRATVSYIEPIFKSSFLTFSYEYKYNFNNADRFAYDLMNEAKIDSAYSNSFRNTFQSQRAGVNFKTVKEKYIYSIGVNVDPSRSESENLIDTARTVPSRTVVNVSPNLFLIYRMNKRNNLRFDYRGRTRQPSISQLQPVSNITDPLRIRTGNPSLSPSYENNVQLRFNSFKPENQQSIMAYMSGGFTTNSIVNKTTYNSETGGQTTMPVNVNGVWNMSASFMYNTPLKNKKFQINSFTNLGYNNNIGFVTLKKDGDSQRNVSRTFNVRESAGITYRSDWFDIGLRGNYYYSRTGNSLPGQNSQDIMTYGGSFDGSLHLPCSIDIGTNFDYSGNKGYSSGYDKNQMLWNAQASWQFLKGKNATLMFKIYDILQQRSSISRSVTGNYIQDMEYNTLTSYCMLQFSYRFNAMGGRRNSDVKQDSRPNRHKEGYRMGPPPGEGSRGYRIRY